jgi:hypothetical protein
MTALIAVLIMLGGAPAGAQETRGSIGGRVVDSSGALVPNVTVTATNLATNVKLKAVSNHEGSYQILFVLPGVYSVSASIAGFKAARQDNIEIRIHERVQVDFALEVGSLSEEVQVSAEAPQLQTANANMGQVVDTRRISELPVAYGSPYSLLFLLPGVADIGQTRQENTPTSMDVAGSNMSFNGAPRGSTGWTIDGSENKQDAHPVGSSGTAVQGGPANSPPADIVHEFKLESAFDASVGFSAGSVVNLTLKTGTNLPHGSAYGFFRNPDWNANTFFGNRNGQPKADFNHKRWGTSLLGPVFIPKIYNGRNRTFFAYAYEGLRSSSSDGSYTGSVPVPQHVAGDFSNLLAVDALYQIYDPATITPASQGRYAALPFARNIIPSSRINPIAAKILEHYPKPNAPGRSDGVNNYVNSSPIYPDVYFNHTARIDHNIDENQRLYGRLSLVRRNVGPYRPYWNDVAVGEVAKYATTQAALDDVYVVNPTVVLNFRYGFSRSTGGHTPPRVGYDLSQLGFPASTLSQLTGVTSMFPRVSISGLATLGNEAYDRVTQDLHSFFAGLNKQHANHNLKAGLDARLYRETQARFGEASGNFSFSTNYTRGPLDNSPTSPSGVGQGLASLLLGIPSSGTINRNDTQAVQSAAWGLYLHDNWRVTPKLTLDLGLRWEYEAPLTERFNRSVRGFDPAAPQSIENAARAAYAAAPDTAVALSDFRVRGGLRFAGAGGESRGLWDGSLRGFAPRFGFAYQGLRRMVLRGGFGLYPIMRGVAGQHFAIQSGFDQDTQLVPTLNGGQTFIGTLANPFPTGLLRASGAGLGAATFLGRGVNFYNPVGRVPYTTQWGLNTQTMLPGQFLLEVGYVGTKSIKLMVDRDLNALPNQYLSTLPERDQKTIDYLSANVPNPFSGLLPGTTLNGTIVSRNQLLRPYPQFSNVTMTDYQGWAWYNSLQVRLERRLRRGFTLLAGYNFSKNIVASSRQNAADPRPAKVISEIDRPHSLSVSGLWELPFGKGRTWLSSTNRLADLFVGGWQLSAVVQLNSGFPLSFGDVVFNGDIKGISLSKGERSIDRWFNTTGFNRNAAQQFGSHLRTFPLRLSGVRSSAYHSADISLLKNFAIHERHRVQFRAEFYNAFNHPTAFGAPNTSPTSSAFGTVTGMLGLPREVQLGVKYVF